MFKPVCIFGAGESAKSAFQLIKSLGLGTEVIAFIETDKTTATRQVYGIDVQPISFFDSSRHRALLAIGMPQNRAKVAAQLPADTEFASYIHPDAFRLNDEEFSIGPGCIVFPQVYFSRTIKIGAHAIIMPGTVVGHDVTIGTCVTTSANVSIGGGVTFGDRVFCGLGVAIRDHITVCDDVFLGMSAAVTRNIERAGAYKGNPAHRITKVQPQPASHSSVAAGDSKKIPDTTAL